MVAILIGWVVGGIISAFLVPPRVASASTLGGLTLVGILYLHGLIEGV